MCASLRTGACTFDPRIDHATVFVGPRLAWPAGHPVSAEHRGHLGTSLDGAARFDHRDRHRAWRAVISERVAFALFDECDAIERGEVFGPQQSTHSVVGPAIRSRDNNRTVVEHRSPASRIK